MTPEGRRSVSKEGAGAGESVDSGTKRMERDVVQMGRQQ